MSKKRRSSEKVFVSRDPRTGRFIDVVIADPAVRPRSVTIEKIRRAVRTATSKRESDRPHAKD
jgi:hypothetical protein